MSRLKIGLFNDSFPPTIDGVAQVVKNYAAVLHKNHVDVTVITPEYKGVKDDYDFEVFRYPSLPSDRRIGYRIGNPFDPETLFRLRSKHFDLMHVHAPFASSLLVKSINYHPRVPVVLTYHTKFDLDIAQRVSVPGIRKVAMRFLRKNLNAADEMWVVSEGCGRALRDVGYRGSYKVMENGIDFVFGRAEEGQIHALRAQHGVHPQELVFLFVGRMLWCKNTRLILDTLRLLHGTALPFRAFFVGDGYEASAIRQYAADCGLSDCVTFTGAIYDREQLRVYYSMAQLFLFPSTYDTCGIVVGEAAACECPSLLLRGSCAAEKVQHGLSGFLAQESPEDCCRVLLEACSDRNALRQVGKNAGRHLYLSWETAVERAYMRYVQILETFPGSLPYNAKSGW